MLIERPCFVYGEFFMAFVPTFRISTRSLVTLLVPVLFMLAACGSQTQSADTSDLVKISAPTDAVTLNASQPTSPASGVATSAPAVATVTTGDALATTAPVSTATVAPASPTA